METFGNQAASQITLTAGVSAGATTWPISALGTGAFVIPSDGVYSLMCDDEIVKVTAVSGLNLTVTRGQESTTAAAHASGVRVYHWLTRRSMEELMQAYTSPFVVTGSPAVLTIPGTLHDFDFLNDPPVVQIYDAASPVRQQVGATSVQYHYLTGDITITFVNDQSGNVIVLGRP